MAIATTNTRSLTPIQKTEKGAVFIALGTTNPQVPGNAALLAAFTTSQTNLIASIEAVNVARDALRQAIMHRNSVEEQWDNNATLLCAFTETATGGNPEGIVSAGFGVRATPTPPEPLGAPEDLRVRTNGTPGLSKLTWKLENADTFLVQCSMDEVAPVTWNQVVVTTKARCELPGAQPGKVCWFRVAGVNAAGQGPWSVAIPRPVM